MNGIIISIDPIIFRLGEFQFRWYTLAIMAAVVTAVIIATREFKRKDIPVDNVFSMLPWALLGGFVGARMFHIFDRWDYYSANLGQIIQLQQGGLAIWGGVIGGALAVTVYSMVRHMKLWSVMDALVPALIAAQMVGRLGCIVNGDAYGGVTDLPWGFIYAHPDALIPSNLMGIPTHPYPVYEMLWNGASLLLLLKLRGRFHRDGVMLAMYLTLYSAGRLVLSFVRQENMIVSGLQQAQVIALLILAASVVVLAYVLVKNRQARLHLQG